MEAYHVPVMLEECLEGLNIEPNGVYVDVTFGGGGHSKAIVERLEGGKLYAFDQDEEARETAKGLPADRFQLIEANFRHLRRYLRVEGVRKVDGILADLGVSSHQIDTAERGFSIRKDAALDMRMNNDQELTARQVLEDYSQEELARVLYEYAELRNSRPIARALIQSRGGALLSTTAGLVEALKPFAPARKENQFYAKVFQALRMEVNDETGALKELLEQSTKVLKEQGRLVVMAYHSLEDRPVKNFMRTGNLEGKANKDFFGNPLCPFKLVNRKPIMASEEELARNPRARSAKLRIATFVGMPEPKEPI